MEYLPVQHGKMFLTPGAVLNVKSSRQKKVFSNRSMNNILMEYFSYRGNLQREYSRRGT